MKTVEKFLEIIESRGIGVDSYTEENVLCGYELNTYTEGGVNQIVFLDFRDSEMDITNPDDFIEVFSEYVDNIDIDEEVETNRQDASYKAVFTLSDGIEDFRAWKEELESILEELKNS